MRLQHHFFTSEAVTEGHLDKVCDQISDAILDAPLREEPFSRCVCETTCEPGHVHIMGEITTKAKVDYAGIARDVIRRIGYTKSEYGFDADTVSITSSLHEQLPDIAMGVDESFETKSGDKQELGAGDGGIRRRQVCARGYVRHGQGVRRCDCGATDGYCEAYAFFDHCKAQSQKTAVRGHRRRLMATKKAFHCSRFVDTQKEKSRKILNLQDFRDGLK